jgi:DNA helicase IV
MASTSAAELAQEQAYLTMLYERLDVLRAVTEQRLAAVHLGPTAENDQGWSERESFAELYQDRAAELDAAERNLCFGRLDFDDGDRFYIGRLGLRSDDHDQLLVDWRARAAEPFYRATPRERYAVTRRRHLHTVNRRVVSLDDDVLDLDAVDETRLTGEAALLASLRRGRTGRMGDIVATIQADQDRIIREDPGGVLVVEGGPGTGKTVVALHRAAYLLYTYRKRLARRGILVIGPSTTFLRYIDQVLPSLGENEVVLATTGSLFPGVDARSPESPRAARVKGDIKMAGVLPKAVAYLRQVPATAIEIKIDGATYRLTPRMCGKARAEAEGRRDPDTGAPLPHNTARRAFINAVVRDLARQRVRDLGGQRILQPGDGEDLRAELAAAPAIRSSESPWYAGAGGLAELVRRETELTGTGRLAVIAPPARVAETAATLNLAPGPDLDAPVAVLTPEQAKGLEFDSVIIVDPAGIEQASPRGRADLYVALTRTTRRLGLISPGEMPRDLRAILDQSPTHNGPDSVRLT